MALGINQSTAGQTFTSEDVRSTIIEPLRSDSLLLAAARKVMYSHGDPLRIPKISSTNLADIWRAENAQIAESTPTLSDVVLLPSSLKSAKITSRLPNELVRHAVTSGNIGELLGDNYRQDMARAIDAALLLGDGASDTPLGLANKSGVQVVSSVGSLADTAGIDKLHDAVLLAMEANAREENLAWFMAPRSLNSLRKSKAAGSGEYVFQPDPTVPARPTLFGRPIYSSPVIPKNLGSSPANKSVIILADVEQFVVGIDEDLSVQLYDQTFADYDQTLLRIVARFDVAALNPEAIIRLDGVQP